jgi:branched-chain amino acid transport system substrate-binding protein
MQARRFATLVLCIVATGCGSRGDPEPFTIGQVVALSGANREAGEHARNGAGLAIEMATAEQHRVLGRRVAVRHVDDRGDATSAGPEAVRLLTLNRAVALLGGPDAAAGEELARAARTYGTPVLLTADMAQMPAGESVFLLNAAPAARGAALARYAIAELHCHHVVALTGSDNPIATDLVAAFVKRWSAHPRDDQSARVDAHVCHNDAEWTEQCQRAVAAKPDAVLLAADPQEFGNQRARLQSAGQQVPVLYGGPDVGAADLAEANRERLSTYRVTAFAADADLGPKGKAFVEQYQQRFHIPPDLPAALAFDGVQLVIDALERCQSPQPVRLCGALQSAEYASVTGPLSLADRHAKRRLFVMQSKNGESKVVAASGPADE